MSKTVQRITPFLWFDLKDRYGLSWQIVPAVLPELLSGDAAQSERVMTEIMKMIKIDIATLKKAAAGG